MKYFYVENEQITGKGTLRLLDEGTLNIEVSDEVFENQEMYIYSNGEIILDPNYEETILKKTKEAKHIENNEKASEARYNQEFTIKIQEQDCVFDTTAQTQLDLNTATNYCIATSGTYDGWITNNGVELNLSLEDVALIGATFKAKANVYDKWNEYKQAIDEAETLEEVEAIEINYQEENNETT